MLHEQKFPRQPGISARYAAAAAAAAEACMVLLKVLLLLSHPVRFQETLLNLPESD